MYVHHVPPKGYILDRLYPHPSTRIETSTHPHTCTNP